MTVPARPWLLIAAVVIGLAARLPGLWWGDTFDGGFRPEHVDEYTHLINTQLLVNPQVAPPWHPQAYPKGLAAHVAVPLIAARAVEHRLMDAQLPSTRTIVLLGRAVSIAYGVASIVVLWLLTRRLAGRTDVANVAAWLLALGGLHVTQSHFFVADVPALFWFLVGTHLLLRDADEPEQHLLMLPGAAFALGLAVGLKLFLPALPALAICALRGRPRFARCVFAAAFFLAGAVTVNVGAYSPFDLYKTIAGTGVTGSYVLNRSEFPLLYAIELLPVAGAPVVLAALVGLFLACRRLIGATAVPGRRASVLIICVLPVICHLVMMATTLDPFPRHLLPLLPWLHVLAAIALCAVPGRARLVLLTIVIAWSAANVVDAERGFVTDNRADAFAWIKEHAAPGETICWPAYERDVERLGLKPQQYPEAGNAQWVVAEDYRVNHLASGTGRKNTFPTDSRRVFAARSDAYLRAWQDIVRGAPPYGAPAYSLPNAYFMPEARLADDLLGNRSRNYRTAIDIYRLR